MTEVIKNKDCMKEQWPATQRFKYNTRTFGRQYGERRGMFKGGGEREKIIFLPNTQSEKFRILPSKQTSH